MGPNVNWQIRVTADEGTEGTITDLGISTLVVGNGATIVLDKTVAAVLDPVTGPVNPKSIPGATMEYVITATNAGPLATDIDTVVVGDLLPTGVTLLFGSPIAPVAFADGPIASGLSYVFTNVADGADDLAFSNDGGTTFVTPTVDDPSFTPASSNQLPDTRRSWPAQNGSRRSLRLILPTGLFGNATVVISTPAGFL